MALYADPKTGSFHVGYLYTNQTSKIGGAAAAVTDDLVTYRGINTPDPSWIYPGGKNDPVAVFDGSIIPQGYQGKPTFLYTSVSYPPISWTLAYIPGSETQSLAISNDTTGRNFTKLEQGPVISSAPFAVNVTGWRDPYVFQSPYLDKASNSTNNTWYAIISGGVHGVGGSQFLYRQYNSDFTLWEYLGQWWTEPQNSTWGDGQWAGRWGFNFEVGNVFTLNDKGEDPNGYVFTTLGTEGGLGSVPGGRAQLWAAGEIQTSGTGPKFVPNMAGKLDWGYSAYAAAGKVLPSSSLASQKSGAPDRFITYLWLTNDFYGGLPFPIAQQGWDAILLTPRELYVKTIYNVLDNDLARQNGSWMITNRKNQTVDLVTLGITPAREAIAAYKKNATTTIEESDKAISVSNGTTVTPFGRSPSGRFYMMQAALSFPASARQSQSLQAGFQILSSQAEKTVIYYQFSNESFIVDRSQSSAVYQTTQGFDRLNQSGKFRLWEQAQPDGSTKLETLNLTLIVDNGIVELFANDRFALSTQVWPWYQNSTGLSYFTRGSSGFNVSFTGVKVYEGLIDAWPLRK